MTKWERMVSRLKYFEGKKITELSTEEINEFLELRKEATQIAEGINRLIINPIKKAISEFPFVLAKAFKRGE